MIIFVPDLIHMIVYYTQEKATIQLETTSVCDAVCSSNCLKPKSKCCNKYKKKGVNCKRCPNVLLKFAS